jgi:DNA-binding response OmpR family regulator
MTEGALARLLLVHQEPVGCRIIAEHLRENAGAEVECTPTATEAATMITGGRFDLAIIDAMLLKVPGVQLATLAANQDTPVLLLSENRSTSTQLRRLGYPYLEKPLDLGALVSESRRIIVGTRLNIQKGIAAADRIESDVNALEAEIAESHRLFDLAMNRLGYKKG